MTRTATPIPEDRDCEGSTVDGNRTSTGTEATDERTLTGENPKTGEAGDAEKCLRKRAPRDGLPQEKEAKEHIPPEERDWQEDLVTCVYT
jgi:hypothetical protein